MSKKVKQGRSYLEVVKEVEAESKKIKDKIEAYKKALKNSLLTL